MIFFLKSVKSLVVLLPFFLGIAIDGEREDHSKKEPSSRTFNVYAQFSKEILDHNHIRAVI
jgi:hypothetical protein